MAHKMRKRCVEKRASAGSYRVDTTTGPVEKLEKAVSRREKPRYESKQLYKRVVNNLLRVHGFHSESDSERDGFFLDFG